MSRVTYPNALELHVSWLSGKLRGIASISTSCLKVSYCQSSKAGICQHCYARKALLTFRSLMQDALARNTVMLSEQERHLDLASIPRIDDAKALRFNSHGELTGPVCLRNFVRIAQLNKHLPVALWTKRDNVVRKVDGELEHPVWPMKLIYSSPELNTRYDPGEPFDHTFTVYTPGTAMPDGTFECPGKCAECMVCYVRELVPGTTRHIGIYLHN